MFAVTRDYLLILRAEVDVERLFNIAQDILGLRRTLLGLETIRALILVKDYLCCKELGQI